MQCEFCGEEVSPGALACPRCGSPVLKASTPQGAPAASQEAGAPPTHAEASRLPGTGPRKGVSPPSLADITVPPADVPLAKQEEDFIALAEEQVSIEERAEKPQAFSRETGSAGVVAAYADQEVPPGAHVAPEAVTLETSLTGGYKEADTGPSVAGAGVQTADDPFGLNITETAPPAASEAVPAGGFNWRAALNVAIILITAVVVGVVVFIGVNALKNRKPSRTAPVESLRTYVNLIVATDSTGMENVAVPGAVLGSKIYDLLKPYDKLGTMRVKDFDAQVIKNDGKNAQLDITKFIIELMTTSGKELIDVLEIKEPHRLQTTVNLIYQNGNWLVTN